MWRKVRACTFGQCSFESHRNDLATGLVIFCPACVIIELMICRPLFDCRPRGAFVRNSHCKVTDRSLCYSIAGKWWRDIRAAVIEHYVRQHRGGEEKNKFNSMASYVRSASERTSDCSRASSADYHSLSSLSLSLLLPSVIIVITG